MGTRVRASAPREVGDGPQFGGMDAAQREMPAESLPGHWVVVGWEERESGDCAWVVGRRAGRGARW